MQTFLIKANGTRGGKIAGPPAAARPAYAAHGTAANTDMQPDGHMAAARALGEAATHAVKIATQAGQSRHKKLQEKAATHLGLAQSRLHLANIHTDLAGLKGKLAALEAKRVNKPATPTVSGVNKSHSSNTHQETDMHTFLIKAESKGEGSRGGKIIGHTKGSNRPIYASHGPGHSDYHGFSSSDHSDAAAVHGAAAMRSFKKLREAKGDAKAQQHYSEGLMHHGAAILHSEHASMHSSNAPTGKAKASSSAKRGQAKASTSGPVKLKRKKNHDWDAAIKDPRLWNSHNAEDDAIDTENAHRLIAAHPHMTAADHRKRGSDLAYSRGKGSAADNHRGTAHHVAADILSERGSAKKSQAADVLQGYLSKAAKHFATTSSGAAIQSPMHSGYDGVDMHAHHAEAYKGIKSEVAINKKHAPIVKQMYPHFSAQDHHDAYRAHEGNNSHAIAGAHLAASGYLKPKGVKKSMSQAADVLQGYLSKAQSKGEGSRGGKIIGHTKGSNRPIYASHGPGHSDYHGFSSSDHSDAAAVHGAAAMRSFKKLREAKGDAKAQQHYSEGLMHHGAAILHSEHASMHSSNAPTGSAKRGQAKASTSGPVKLKRKKNHDWDAAIKDPRLWNSHNAEDDAIDTENAHRLIAAHPHMTAADHRKRGSDLAYSRGKGSAADNHRGTAHHVAADILSERGSAKKSQAADVLQGYLSKAESKGEGSRGGKIIGHTKSGKPIYGASHNSYSGIQDLASQGASMGGHGTAARDAHPGYTKQDHADAMYAHSQDEKKEGQWSEAGLASANASHAHWTAFKQMRSRAAKNGGDAKTGAAKKSQAADVLQDGLSKSDTLQIHFHTMWAPKEAYTPSVVVN